MMQQPPRHPDDATLFDFAEGALDADAMADVSHHVERCAACAGFLTAAARGGELLGAAVEPMPAAAVQRLRLTLDEAWQVQHAADPVELPTSKLRPARATRAARDRGRERGNERSHSPWRRRAVPILACVLLAILAGTSYVLVDDQGGSTSATRSTSGDTSREAAAPTTAPPTSDTAAPAAPDSDIGADAVAGAGTSNATTTSTTTIPAPSERICIAGHDVSQLVLPDQRQPTRLIEGPLGIVIVCG